ncbi:uncharacterized protein LOC133841488 isoform X1 [Drosophila sulfurigaster albostrigata]|uniref:uncharacterized protein LOC133841488 isoform X1 n=1 Tax=Drosophila sulfurigaster albostrigata TaxID=89887 RepID=UPI002D219DE3|nr:uncharacterized protein LOC133841488 isoform X1 [Drosophila sulfurigaster albostrigata]
MDIILPDLQDEQRFLDCASRIQYDEFNAKLFAFYAFRSDVDVYQLIADDRLVQLILAWDACQLHSRESITEELIYIVKVLVHHSLQLWFGQEWMSCAESLRRMLLYYLGKAANVFAQLDGLCDIDWQYLLNFQTNPWHVSYLQHIFANLAKNKHHVIEHSVPPATVEDVTYFRQEHKHLIILRLLKLFDAGSMEAVKQLSLRILASWLKCNATDQFGDEHEDQEQESITLVAHLYLLTVFTLDDNRGYVIDNMMYNIRFYAQSMQEAPHEEDYTPARLIAQVCVRLGLGKDGFFERIVLKKFNLSMTTPFAVMLKAYTSYVLGNQLLELMALNEHDFMAQLDQFKSLMNQYIKEREGSEEFLLNELQKLELQRHSHALPHTMNMKLNYQQQICKGNRSGNIGNYKNCDDDEKPLPDVDEEMDRQIDPVFQKVPNNENVLDFVYQLLAARSFRGWQFAKIALLLKIIGQKLNTIEVWRYHPGLTTQFMLNLENNLSVNYADLAKVFSEQGFMESEFWLTAFYLNPTSANYNEVKRCSRYKKKRKEDDEQTPRKESSRAEKVDHTKYELLSSTIDVDEIVAITNHNAPVTDYDPICKALQALRLPSSIIKDLLTVAFQPRNKRYSWALEWSTLHERCGALLKSRDLKNKFVALNMAEANDRLKFLKIDYAKYKNRPQLDYGTIEEGYENAVGGGETEGEASADEDEDEAQKAAREKAEKERKRKRNTRKFWDEVTDDEEEEEDHESDDSEAYYTGSGRRTRVRAAAVVANAMITDMDRAMRSGRRSPAAETETKQQEVEEPKSQVELQAKPPIEEPSPQKRSFDEVLQAQAKYNNETNGFKAFVDIWSFEKEEAISADNDNKLMESNTLLGKFRNLQGLRQRTTPVNIESRTAAVEVTATTSDDGVRRLSSNSEADSLHSGTSTMAMRDASECDDGQSGVSKELTPPPRTSDFTRETQVFQLNIGKVRAAEEAALGTNAVAETVAAPKTDTVTTMETKTFTEQVRETPTRDLQGNYTKDQLVEPQREMKFKLERASSTESEMETLKELPCIKSEPASNSESHIRSIKLEQDSNAENSTDQQETVRHSGGFSRELTARLIEECLMRKAEVRLHRLSIHDIEKLRRVRVLVKRTNFREYYREQERPASRGKRSQPHTEDSNASTTTSETKRKKSKRFVHITSDTPTPIAKSLNSENSRFKHFKRFKHITSDSSTSTDQEDRVVRPPSVKRRRGPKFYQTALKIKQKKPLREKHVTADSVVIELSSESRSSSSSPVPMAVSGNSNRFPDVAMPRELDPLYEEAIVPF